VTKLINPHSGHGVVVFGGRAIVNWFAPASKARQNRGGTVRIEETG
jgi:hypothetical protein